MGETRYDKRELMHALLVLTLSTMVCLRHDKGLRQDRAKDAEQREDMHPRIIHWTRHVEENFAPCDYTQIGIQFRESPG